MKGASHSSEKPQLNSGPNPHGAQLHGVLPVNFNLLGTSGLLLRNFKFSYHIGETLLFTIYTHYGNLI